MNRAKAGVLICLLILVSGFSTHHAQTKSGIQSRDMRVERALNAAKLPFSVLDNGNFSVLMNYTDVARKQRCYISSKTELYEGFETREIWSPAMKVAGVLPAGLANRLLGEKNKFGGWRVEYNNDESFVFYSAQIQATTNATELKAALNLVLIAADRLEHEMTSKDEY